MLQLGILGKIREIEDDSMKFYALIGLCVSTAAAIEHHLFDCFFATSGKHRTLAASEFYKGVQFKPKLDMADASVRAVLASPSVLKYWDEIVSEIRAHCGGEAARNLVSHNALAANVYIRKNSDGTPDLDGGSALYMELAVNQNFNQVLAGRRAPAKQTFDSLNKDVYGMLGAEHRVMEFHRANLARFLQPHQG